MNKHGKFSRVGNGKNWIGRKENFRIKALIVMHHFIVIERIGK